jgi:hypothetical protein
MKNKKLPLDVESATLSLVYYTSSYSCHHLKPERGARSGKKKKRKTNWGQCKTDSLVKL